jgi:hypothetical protein
VKCKIIDNEVYERRILYRSRSMPLEIFHVGETDENIIRIKKNNERAAVEEFFIRYPELAQFMMDNACDLEWTMIKNQADYTAKCVLTAYIRPKDYTFITLKFGDKHLEVDALV